MPYSLHPSTLLASGATVEAIDGILRQLGRKAGCRLTYLRTRLETGDAGAAGAIGAGEARIQDPGRTEELAENVIASAKGWLALGAMDSAERSRALDLLGFTSQLVFPPFSLGLFAFSADLDAAYGGASAPPRIMAAFCGDQPPLCGYGLLP